MKTIIIHQLSGKNIEFEFDINEKLRLFRQNILTLSNIKSRYTITSKGHVIIYDNDKDDNSVKKLLESSPDESLAECDKLDFYLTYNFGYPRMREGKLLVSQRFTNN